MRNNATSLSDAEANDVHTMTTEQWSGSWKTRHTNQNADRRTPTSIVEKPLPHF